MSKGTIGVMSPGDMGHGVAGAIVEKGYRVLTLLEGRSEISLERAARAYMKDAGTLEELVAQSEVVLSIMPPELALSFAKDLAAATKVSGNTLIFADCNAVSPGTTMEIAAVMEEVGATFVKIGIIGGRPGKGSGPKFYASGPDTDKLAFLDGDGISYRPMGDDLTQAAAIKMCYAGLTKGTMTLHTLVLTAAELLGVSDELRAELETSQAWHWDSMDKRVPFYAADAGRWAGEMDEISRTFGDAGVTPNMHKGAADTFRLLDETPLREETRETLDKSRTLDQSVKIYADAARARKSGKKAAE